MLAKEGPNFDKPFKVLPILGSLLQKCQNIPQKKSFLFMNQLSQLNASPQCVNIFQKQTSKK